MKNDGSEVKRKKGSLLQTYWLFIVLGIAITLAFGVTSIWRSIGKPLDTMKSEFVVMQNRMIEQWTDYQITNIAEGLRYLSRRPVVISATVGETLNNTVLRDAIFGFDLLHNMTAVHVVDVLGETIASRTIDTQWASVYTPEEITAAGVTQLDDRRPIIKNRLAENQNILIATVPILYGGTVEGAIVANFHLDINQQEFQDFGLKKAELLTRQKNQLKTPPRSNEIFSSLDNAELLLKTTWDFSRLEEDKKELIWTLTNSLLLGLAIAFAALGFLGHRMLVIPQRLLEKSREKLVNSEQRARELAEVAEQANDSIVITDKDGRITWLNKSMELLSGYDKEDLIGKTPASMLQGQNTDPDTRAGIASALQQKQPIQTEILNYTKSGTPYWVEIAITPVLDEEDELLRFIAIERNVTQQKEREQELLNARLKAESASEAKSTFLATMSHEIRTPMNGVIGMAEILSDTRLDKDQRMYVDTIKQSGHALLTVINDILDYSKVESGKMTLSTDIFNLHQTIDDVASILTPNTREKGVELIVNIDDNIPSHFLGDEGRVRQIITNLGGNAAKFTLEGRVVISLSGKITEGRNWNLSLAITDSGIGIPKDKIGDLFSAFQQVDGAKNRRFGGTGLGLAISARLSELMGGFISIDSEEDVGSTFTLNLTMEACEQSVQTPEATSSLSNKRALIVDDSELNRRIYERQLVKMQLGVSLAEDAKTAMQQLDLHQQQGTPVDIILLDYVMPNQDGIEFSTCLNDNPAHKTIPRILLSSRDIMLTQNELTHIGIVDHLIKPAREEQIQRSILAALSVAESDSFAEPADRDDPSPQDGDVVEDDKDLVQVLIAEDNDINQLVISGMLEPLNCELSFAENGLIAVETFKSNRPDLILMDWSMPEMDGLEATRTIRALEVEQSLDPVPIIALTANAMQGDEDTCREAGMSDYLTKPIQQAALFQKMQNLEPRLITDVNDKAA